MERVERLLSYKQASRKLGIPLGTLYCMVSKKEIGHIRLGKRLVRFSEIALDEFIAQHSVMANGSTKKTPEN